MPLRPVNRNSVPEDVFDQIVAEVLGGRMQPGEMLPSERRLAKVLEVSRPAVREALKRVSATGLVKVRQGESTTVRDFRRHAGLDLLPRLILRAGEIDFSVARSILEARVHNGPKVAELAAQRRPPELAALLNAVVDELEAAEHPIERQRHALSFWDHVADGADSIVFRLMYNTFREVYEQAMAVPGVLLVVDAGSIEGYRAVASAIIAGDPAAAKQCAQDLLDPTTAALSASLKCLED